MSLLGRLDAALLRRHQRTCPWPTGSGAITTKRAKEPGMGQDVREGGSKAMEGARQVIAYTDVIKPADEADWCAHVTLAQVYREERDNARDEVEQLRVELQGAYAAMNDDGDTIARLETRIFMMGGNP